MPLDEMRQQLELRLRGELLRDWCRELAARDPKVEFDDAWCSNQRVIRFSTRSVDELVGSWRGSGDCWGLGRLAFYEIENDADSIAIALVASMKGMPSAIRKRVRAMAAEAAADAPAEDRLVLRRWELAEGPCPANEAVGLLDVAWDELVKPFDDGIARKRAENVSSGSLDDVESLIEGAEYATISDRFERNKKARALCIEAHGAICAICGFDFGKAYGSELAGTIDVHHRRPLSEIREGYVVDPVRDLVPVCPNCHRVLHSKPGGGAFTVDEVRAMLKRDDAG